MPLYLVVDALKPACHMICEHLYCLATLLIFVAPVLAADSIKWTKQQLDTIDTLRSENLPELS